MKKIISGLTVGAALLAFSVSGVAAKPSSDTCIYIRDGILQYATGHYLEGDPLTMGYDVFGYNYQGHIFQSSYANAYLGRPGSGLPPYTGDDSSYLAAYPSAASHWAWPYRNIQLQMKWNDAWLANKDCNGNEVLDRASDPPVGTYIGSGAWLTNHAEGTYTGSAWDVSGNYVLSFNYLGSLYVHDMVVTGTDGSFSGTGSYPSGGPSTITWTVTGTVTGSNVTFDIDYDGSGYAVHGIGTITAGGTLSGTWTSNSAQAGTWSATSGVAVHPVCPVSDFVKIIAVPASATKYADNVWHAADGTEIGPDIWGEFAIIQESGEDPCNEYGVIDYISPLRTGLGGW